VQKLNNWWLRYEYKHTTVALLLLLGFIVFFDTALAAALFDFVERLNYGGALIAGVLSVSFFTAVPAFVLLIDLAQHLPAVPLALVGGFGAMIGDWLLLQFFDDRVAYELRPLFKKLKLDVLLRKLEHRYTSWILLLGSIVVISTPLPDEIGITMMGISHFKRVALLAICFVLNTLGLLVLILAVQSITG